MTRKQTKLVLGIILALLMIFTQINKEQTIQYNSNNESDNSMQNNNENEYKLISEETAIRLNSFTDDDFLFSTNSLRVLFDFNRMVRI